MPLIYWNGHFALGLPEIDAQHAHLVDLVNELAEAVADAGRLPLAATLIEMLQAYAVEHFRDEERLMPHAALDAAELAAHRREHRLFAERIDSIRRAGPLHQAEFATEVLGFLTTWLIAHILGSDRRLVGALPGRARAEESAQGDLAVPPMARVLIDALLETERRFRLISDCAPAPMWVCDRRGQRDYYNRAWFELLDETPDAGAFDHLARVVAADRDAYADALQRLVDERRAGDLEYRVAAPTGEVWLLERVRPRLDGGGNFAGLIASATDITALRQSEARLAAMNRTLEAEVARRTAELEALTLTDPLTGIGNRRHLMNGLKAELRRAQRYRRPFAAIFLDIDHFKSFNDRHGHRHGDAVLAGVAKALRAAVRDVDVLGRWGGEEFVVLLPEATLAEAATAAERLRAAIASMEVAGVAAREVSASAGVAVWRAGEDGESLLRRADSALYAAKAAGRDRVSLDAA